MSKRSKEEINYNFWSLQTCLDKEVGIVGHFQKKAGKRRSTKKEGKVRPA